MAEATNSGMDELTIQRLTGMTLAQAGAVIWTMRGNNLPIAEALATDRIKYRDLAWATENAYDQRLKTAARTILLSRLGGKQLQLPMPLKVVNGSRYSEWRERIATLMFGMLFGSVLVLFLVLLVAGIFGAVTHQRGIIALGNIAALISFPVLYIALNRAVTLADEAENFRYGRWGEEKIIEQLRIYLDGSWTVYHGFEWPGSAGGDIDIILVGPKGVWALEVKAYSGEIRNEYDRWQKKRRLGWWNLSSHPGKQARRNAEHLRRLLYSSGISVRWVQPVVVWAMSENDPFEEKASLSVKRPETPVWKLDDFAEGIAQMQDSSSRLSDGEISKINAVLVDCVDDVKRKHAPKKKTKPVSAGK